LVGSSRYSSHTKTVTRVIKIENSSSPQNFIDHTYYLTSTGFTFGELFKYSKKAFRSDENSTLAIALAIHFTSAEQSLGVGHHVPWKISHAA